MIKHLFEKYLLPIFLMILLILATSCSIFKEDNILEEIAEDVIEDNVGVKVDFTPDTPEEK